MYIYMCVCVCVCIINFVSFFLCKFAKDDYAPEESRKVSKKETSYQPKEKEGLKKERKWERESVSKFHPTTRDREGVRERAWPRERERENLTEREREKEGERDPDREREREQERQKINRIESLREESGKSYGNSEKVDGSGRRVFWGPD